MTFLSKRILMTTGVIVIALSALQAASIYLYYHTTRSRSIKQVESELGVIAKDNKDIFLANTVLKQDLAVEMLKDEIKRSRNLQVVDWTCHDMNAACPEDTSGINGGNLDLMQWYKPDVQKCCALTVGKSVQSFISSTEYRRHIYMLIAFAGSLLIVIGVGIIVTMETNFTKPIQRIFDVIDRLAQDKLDLHIGVPKNEFEDIIRKLISLGEGVRTNKERIAQQSTMAAIGQISSHIAHDMRSPLSVLETYIKKNGVSADTEEAELRSAAARSVRKLLHMANDLVDYAKATKVERTTVDLNRFMTDSIVMETRSKSLENNVRIRLMTGDNIYANLDAYKMGRVMVNLVNNSMQAISHDHGEIAVSTGIENGATLVIEVVDNGKGIELEHMPHIFDSFYTAGKIKGIGLGLSYCKQVVEAHDGTIGVESEAGKGTKFTIKIPNCVVPYYKPVMESKTARIDFLGRRFLVVDDDNDVRRSWKQIIEEEGGQVIHEARSSNDVIKGDSVDGKSIDAAIVDYNFPDSALTGVDVIRHLRSRGVKEIHLCTGYSNNKEIREAALAAGATSVIGKSRQER